MVVFLKALDVIKVFILALFVAGTFLELVRMAIDWVGSAGPYAGALFGALMSGAVASAIFATDLFLRRRDRKEKLGIQASGIALVIYHELEERAYQIARTVLLASLSPNIHTKENLNRLLDDGEYDLGRRLAKEALKECPSFDRDQIERIMLACSRLLLCSRMAIMFMREDDDGRGFIPLENLGNLKVHPETVELVMQILAKTACIEHSTKLAHEIEAFAREA